MHTHTHYTHNTHNLTKHTHSLHVHSTYILYIRTHQIKYKLHNSRSNNQAEQTAILKALKTLWTIKLSQSDPRTAKIHTDSRITLLSLKNLKNRKNLIEGIRKKTATLKREKWKIVFTWIKAMQEIVVTN